MGLDFSGPKGWRKYPWLACLFVVFTVAFFMEGCKHLLRELTGRKHP